MEAQNKFIFQEEKNAENKFIFSSSETHPDGLIPRNKYILPADLNCENDSDAKGSTDQQYDCGYGWCIVLGAVICNISFSLPALSFGVIYLEFLERFKHSAATTAYIGAINTMSIGLFGKGLKSYPPFF